MRLLIVTNDFPPKLGGIQMYLQNLVNAYPDPVHVVAPATASSKSTGESKIMSLPQTVASSGVWTTFSRIS